VFVRRRSRSTHLALALLTVVLLALGPNAAARDEIQAISVATNQVEYVNATGLNTVRAIANVSYSGNLANLDPVRFDWYDPGASTPFRTTYVRTSPVASSVARAEDSWIATREGTGFNVTATVNVTRGSATKLSAYTLFNVVAPRVSTWITRDFDSPGRVTLDPGLGPYGICSDTTVAVGTELVVQAGTVILFCRDTGLFINGILTVDGLPASKAYFLSHQADMRAGDWKGIVFRSSALPDSIIANAVIQATTTGLTVATTSVRVVNSMILLASGPAVRLIQSASILSGNTIGAADVGIRIETSVGPILEANDISTTRIGILVTDSSVRLTGNDVSRCREAGVQALRSVVDVLGGTFRENGDRSIFLSHSQSARIVGVTLIGGNDSVRAEDSTDLLIASSALSGARYRSVYFVNVSAILENTTLAAQQSDLVLVASNTTLINTTYIVPELLVSSVLTVKNYLHVLVETNLGQRVPNASVNVTADGVVLSILRTDGNGWRRWLLLTDRVVDTNGEQEMTNVVHVLIDGFRVIASPREADMRTSHMERFIALSIGPASYANIGVDAFLLLLLAALLGLLVLAIPLYRRRKEARSARPRPMPGELVLDPGAVYAILHERPDRAFLLFAEEIAGGAKGLAITRLYPEDVRSRYRIDTATVLWMSRSFGNDSLNPTNLGALAHEIERFVSGKQNSIVLLDGLEYLVVQTDSRQVVRFVQTLVDIVSVHKSRLILPFDQRAFGEADLSLILRDLQTL